MALESLLSDNTMVLNITLNRMVAESEFIISSMENGTIGEFVQEATAKERMQSIINALREFLDKIVAAFRGKIVNKYKKYINWVKENEARIKEKAVNSSITMAPYWEGDQKKGEAEIKTLISDAFKTPYKDDDITFASKLLPSVKTKEDLNDTGKLTSILKNKFRFNKEESDNGKIKKITLSNDSLASKVTDMISYVINYEKVGQSLSSLTNQWDTAARRFTSVNESLDILFKGMFLTVENTSIVHSDLILLEGFDRLPVFEEDGTNGESLTGVENNTDNNDSNNNSNNSTNTTTTDRYKVVDKFVKLAFSSYLTACEERFIVYIKCISQILGESPKEVK